MNYEVRRGTDSPVGEYEMGGAGVRDQGWSPKMGRDFPFGERRGVSEGAGARCAGSWVGRVGPMGLADEMPWLAGS